MIDLHFSVAWKCAADRRIARHAPAAFLHRQVKMLFIGDMRFVSLQNNEVFMMVPFCSGQPLYQIINLEQNLIWFGTLIWFSRITIIILDYYVKEGYKNYPI